MTLALLKYRRKPGNPLTPSSISTRVAFACAGPSPTITSRGGINPAIDRPISLLAQPAENLVVKMLVLRSRLLVFSIILCLGSLAAHGAPAGVLNRLTINQHQRLALGADDLRAAAAAAREKARQAATEVPTLLTVEAYGRSFRLVLEANDQLIAQLPSAKRQRLMEAMQIYRGHLDGIQGSWVRLTRVGERLSGMIWDGAEIYVIDASDEVGAALPNAAGGPSYTLIYRLSDAPGTTSPAATIRPRRHSSITAI